MSFCRGPPPIPSRANGLGSSLAVFNIRHHSSGRPFGMVMSVFVALVEHHKGNRLKSKPATENRSIGDLLKIGQLSMGFPSELNT